MYLHGETLSMVDDALLLMQAAARFMHLDPGSALQPATDVPDSTRALNRSPLQLHIVTPGGKSLA